MNCFVHEFAINYRKINFVISGDFIKFIHKMGCFFAENAILLQPNHIACAVFLTLFIKIRRGETAVITKQNTNRRIIIQVLVKYRLEYRIIGKFIRSNIFKITGNDHIYNLEQLFLVRMISE